MGGGASNKQKCIKTIFGGNFGHGALKKVLQRD